MGAAGYADDLALFAPSRETMKKMLKICEEYGLLHNLVFSTDDNPVKSKSKCLFICGKSDDNLPRVLPAPLQLYGKDLPWVVTATHLGHELHQSGSMEHDCRVKRAMFINSSLEIREVFHFAMPSQVLEAVKLYCLHCYGSMLWDFTGKMTGQFCRSWNTCVKLVNEVPRSTHTFIVEHFLADDFLPVQTELFSRYVKFSRSLQTSVSREVRILASLVSKDIQSNTGKNLAVIQRTCGFNPRSVSPTVIRKHPVKTEVPALDQWRIPVLDNWLKLRREMTVNLQNTENISLLIDALCST